MSNCSSGCPTQTCPSYGYCLRNKGVATTGLESTGPGFALSTQKAWDKELNAYSSAVKQGIQPEAVSMSAINAAVEASQITQTAYQA